MPLWSILALPGGVGVKSFTFDYTIIFFLNISETEKHTALKFGVGHQIVVYSIDCSNHATAFETGHAPLHM